MLRWAMVLPVVLLTGFLVLLSLLCVPFAIAESHGAPDIEPKAPSGQPCIPQEGYEPRIIVNWRPPVRMPPDDATLAHYILERQIDTGPYVALPPFMPDVLRYVDTDVQVGKTYTYQIKARYRFPQDRMVDSTYTLILPTQPLQPCVTILELAPPGGLNVIVQ